MRHDSIPSTLTTEEAAKWIVDNKIETRMHEVRTPLSPEKIKELEHKSSMASRTIDDLKDLEKRIKATIKGGTPMDMSDELEDPVRLPVDFTVPPTKGTKELEANRKFADDMVKSGVEIETTEVYLIPDPENGMVIGVDIEGTEFPEYTRPMTAEEQDRKGKLFKKDDADTVTMYPDRSINDETVEAEVADPLAPEAQKEEPFI